MATPGDSKRLSRQRFGRYAGGYVASPTHAAGADLERLIEIVDPQPDWTALDVATGGGHTALALSPRVARVIAVDLTPEMLRLAEAHLSERGTGNVDFRVADAEDLPFDAGTFDLVTCRIAAHHFPDAARFVAESARVLRPGGLLWVQDHMLSEDQDTARYADAFEKLRDPSHVQAFTESEWLAMFRGADLTVEHTEQLVKRHGFLPWAERQGCTPEVVERLAGRLAEAPEAAAEWMRPRDLGTPQASFVNHHLLIAGRKD